MPGIPIFLWDKQVLQVPSVHDLVVTLDPRLILESTQCCYFDLRKLEMEIATYSFVSRIAAEDLVL